MSAHDTPFKKVLPWISLMGLMFFFSYSGRSLLPLLVLPIAQEFGLNNEEAMTLVMILSIGLSLGMLCSGFLLSRLTARRVVQVAIGGSAFFYLAMPLTGALWQVEVLIAAYGLVVGLYFPAGMATLGDLAAPRDLGKAVAVHELAPNLAFVTVPLFVAFTLTFLEWRQCFALAGAIYLAGSILFTVLGKGGQKKAAPPSFAGLAEIFASPNTWVFMLWFALAVAGEFAIYSVATPYMVDELGRSEESANFILSISRLITPFCVLLGGILADTWSPRRLVGGYLLLHGLALLLMTPPFLPLVIAGLIAQGALTACIFPPLLRVFADLFPVGRQSLVLSISTPAAAFLATGIVPRLLGWAGDQYSFAVGIGVLGIVYLLGLLLFLVPLRKP